MSVLGDKFSETIHFGCHVILYLELQVDIHSELSQCLLVWSEANIRGVVSLCKFCTSPDVRASTKLKIAPCG